MYNSMILSRCYYKSSIILAFDFWHFSNLLKPLKRLGNTDKREKEEIETRTQMDKDKIIWTIALGKIEELYSQVDTNCNILN